MRNVMIRKQWRWIKKILDRAVLNHVGAYASQSAFFFVLSLIPIILLLLTMVQYTPVTRTDVMLSLIHIWKSER